MNSHGFRSVEITRPSPCGGHARLALALGALLTTLANVASASPESPVLAGIASADITPEPPIWLAGYAARNRPGDKVDAPLKVQALALANPDDSKSPFVFVAVDNCEPSERFNRAVLEGLEERHALSRGRVMIVPSHTHAAPVVLGALDGMYPLEAEDRQRLREYAALLQRRLIAAVDEALGDLQPAILEHAVGRATFAMNRRVYKGDTVGFGENPDAPVLHDVPVLRIKALDGALRAVVFGYSCHATSIHGDDFYTISPGYVGYARNYLEELLPGTTAMFLTGMGADINPAPRGSLLDAKRHGLELAGAVVSVLKRPMRPVAGALKFTYAEVALPLEGPPGQAQLEKDATSENRYVRHRAKSYLDRLRRGDPPPGIDLPVAVVRIGDDLTFVSMAGEVVIDYAVRFKRMFAADHPWVIGYAYNVPGYIPSARILEEGGYEADGSLVYYGLYGPFRGEIEQVLLDRMSELVARVR